MSEPSPTVQDEWQPGDYAVDMEGRYWEVLAVYGKYLWLHPAADDSSDIPWQEPKASFHRGGVPRS